MTNVCIVVLPGTTLLDLACVSETFRLANERGARYDMRLIGPESSTSCSIGLRLAGIGPLPEILPQGATVFITGPSDYSAAQATPQWHHTAGWLARVLRDSHRVCAMHSGVLLAAQSGLLNGRSCTTHHQLTDRLSREYPQARVEANRIFVQDGHIYTCAGANAALDLALHLIAQEQGAQLAMDVARTLLVYLRRSGTDLQLSPWLLYGNHTHPALHRVQEAVMRDPARAWTLANLAREACTSPRHLARLFNEHANVSPMMYVRKVRMAAAKELVKQSNHHLGRVAELVGFSSGEQLRRAWQRLESASPQEARRTRKAELQKLEGAI